MTQRSGRSCWAVRSHSRQPLTTFCDGHLPAPRGPGSFPPTISPPPGSTAPQLFLGLLPFGLLFGLRGAILQSSPLLGQGAFQDRDGFVLGEGAGVFVFERLSHAKAGPSGAAVVRIVGSHMCGLIGLREARGANILAEYLGLGAQPMRLPRLVVLCSVHGASGQDDPSSL